MHAYASDDPMFIALNRMAQRETGGAAAEFCIGCHAPMALRTGATADGTDIESVPRHLRGVTCYFCHVVDAVIENHNGALSLASDGVMLGPIANPVSTEAHRSGYSALLDGGRPESAAMCGSCHDVVTPAGVHLERTFVEWRESIFATSPVAPLSCNRCHMFGSDDVVATVEGAPPRQFHDHAMPGVDVALSAWPEKEAQLAGIDRDLGPSISTNLCVTPSVAGGAVDVEVILDNVFAGHAWPSGVTHARRAWVEVVAYRQGAVIFESGRVGPDQAVAELDDPNLWLMRTRIFDEQGDETHFSWRATSIESNLLPPAVTTDPSDPDFFHARSQVYPVGPELPDRVTTSVHVRPVGLEIARELVGAGEISVDVADQIPTFTLQPSRLEWLAADGFGCVKD